MTCNERLCFDLRSVSLHVRHFEDAEFFHLLYFQVYKATTKASRIYHAQDLNNKTLPVLSLDCVLLLRAPVPNGLVPLLHFRCMLPQIDLVLYHQVFSFYEWELLNDISPVPLYPEQVVSVQLHPRSW